MRLLILLLFPILVSCQTICNIPLEDNISIYEKVFFSEEINSQETISIKNNFETSCIRFKKLKNKKIKFYSEQSLYNSLIDDYYTIEQVQYIGNISTIVITQRKKSLFAVFVLKKDNDKWEILNKNIKYGKLKTDDFLYSLIRKKIRENEKQN